MADKKEKVVEEVVEAPALTEDEKNEAVRQEAKRKAAALRAGEKIEA